MMSDGSRLINSDNVTTGDVRYTPSNASKLLLIVCLLGAWGCGPNITNECNDISQVTQQAMDSLMTASQADIGTRGYQISTQENIANGFLESAKTMAALEIHDKELQTVQADLVSAYEQAAADHQAMAALMPSKGIANAERRAKIDQIANNAEAGIPPAIQALERRCIGH